MTPHRSPRRLELFGATLVLLAACGGGQTPKTVDGSGGNSASGGSSTGGSSSGGNTGSGGKPSASGGAMASTGGSDENGSGGATASGGTSTGGTAAGGAAAGGRSASNGGNSAGGSVGGGGKPATTGSGGGGGASSAGGACSRDFLKSTVAAYFKALAAHDATGLPLSDSVKATENGKTIKVGTDGLWKMAGALKFSANAYDTDGCNTASEAVVPEGTTDLPVALRLKIADQKITEIEMIVVRAGDYKVSGSNYPSKPDAISMSDATIMWEKSVPEAMRNTAMEMDDWMSKYYKAFPAGVCNTDANCKRLENGNSPGGCNVGASCQSGAPTGNVIKSHAIFADVETGIGVGWDNFMMNCDMHMFKMYGGKVYAVHAILGACTSTGWSDK